MSRRLDDVVWDATATLADRRLSLELDLIGSILSNPSAGIAYCREVDFYTGAFSHFDLHLMYVAAEEATSKKEVVRLIKRLLCVEGGWDRDAMKHERGPRWSDASLASFACSYPSASGAKQLATRLMNLDQLMRRADLHFSEGMRLLKEAM